MTPRPAVDKNRYGHRACGHHAKRCKHLRETKLKKNYLRYDDIINSNTCTKSGAERNQLNVTTHLTRPHDGDGVFALNGPAFENVLRVYQQPELTIAWSHTTFVQDCIGRSIVTRTRCSHTGYTRVRATGLYTFSGRSPAFGFLPPHRQHPATVTTGRAIIFLVPTQDTLDVCVSRGGR